MNYLGFKEGVKLFDKLTYIVNMPYYLKGFDKFKFLNIDVKDLYCNIIDGNSWDDFTSNIVKIEQSPPYLGLTKDMNIYEKYIAKYLGGPLTENYNLDRYKSLSKDFKYLKAPFETSFIIVQKIDDKYIILDGLHRACNIIAQGKKEIIVCQVSK